MTGVEPHPFLAQCRAALSAGDDAANSVAAEPTFFVRTRPILGAMAKSPDPRHPAKHSKKDPAKPTRAKAARPDASELDPSLGGTVEPGHRPGPRRRRLADGCALAARAGKPRSSRRRRTIHSTAAATSPMRTRRANRRRTSRASAKRRNRAMRRKEPARYRSGTRRGAGLRRQRSEQAADRAAGTAGRAARPTNATSLPKSSSASARNVTAPRRSR